MCEITISDILRKRGIRIVGSSGMGKSTLIGRRLAFGDMCRYAPVMFDPVGASIDNLIDKIGKQEWKVQKQLWKRLRYVDMMGETAMSCRSPCIMRNGKRIAFIVSPTLC